MIKTEQLRAFLPFSPDLATCCLAGPLPFYTPTPRLSFSSKLGGASAPLYTCSLCKVDRYTGVYNIIHSDP